MWALVEGTKKRDRGEAAAVRVVWLVMCGWELE